MAWLRRMLHAFPPAVIGTRRQAVIVKPPDPLPLTRAELERTRPLHRRRLTRADRVLAAYDEADGVLRLFLRRS